MKRAIIVHGLGATPEDNWFPWLGAALADRGFEAYVPEMPDSSNPNADAWLAEIASAVGKPDEDTFLVGHSLGVPAILRYVESLPEGARVGGLLLVSGFVEPIDNKAANAFVEKPFDFEAIKARAKKIVVIHSENDNVVPVTYGLKLRSGLQAEWITIRKGGHLNAGDGFGPFSTGLKALLGMMAPGTA